MLKNNISNLVVKLTDTLKSVLDNLNQSGERIVLVLNDEGRFVGVITDGDIRRHLVNHDVTTGTASDVVNTSPIYIYKDALKADMNTLFQKHGIDRIPVLLADDTIFGLLQKLENGTLPENTAVCIMAGGKGTRLHPETKLTPKPLLEVNGKALLEHLILKFKKEGFMNIYISVNYLSEQIKEFVKINKNFGVNISFLEETEYLGTAGSLSMLQEAKNFEAYLVTNCDVFIETPYREILNFHTVMQSQATLCAAKHTLRSEFGVLKLNGFKLVAFEEKPSFTTYVNAGVYVLSPEIIENLNKEEFIDMPDILMANIDDLMQVNTFLLNGYWIDVGRRNDLETVKNFLK